MVRFTAYHSAPTGARLASAGEYGIVKLWDTRTGHEIRTFSGHNPFMEVDGVSFSPDGERLASASWDQSVKIWDLQTGRCALTLQGHTGIVFWVSFRSGRQTSGLG